MLGAMQHFRKKVQNLAAVAILHVKFYTITMSMFPNLKPNLPGSFGQSPILFVTPSARLCSLDTPMIVVPV